MKYLNFKLLILFAALALAIPPAWAETVTFTAGTDVSSTQSITKNGITMSLSNGTLSRSDNYRAYANSTTTFSIANGTITQIIFNCNASGNSKGGPGCWDTETGTYSYSGKVGTWTGSANEIVFNATQQVQINNFTVTYETAGPGKVDKPTFSPAEGTFYSAQNVAISCTTNGATIYYTTNGATPNTNSAVYNTPIPVNESMTIKAIAVKNGMTNSDVAEATYTIEDPSTLTQYRKITSASGLSAGDYLIVCEEEKVAFDGSLSSFDAVGNKFAVEIENSVISTGKEAFFTLKKEDEINNYYSFKGASGNYFGNNSASNGLTTSESILLNTISFDDEGNAIIMGTGGYVLRYNKASNQTRFRYYNGTQQPVALYKKVSNSPEISVIPSTVTITDATGDDKTGTISATVDPAGTVNATATDGWSATASSVTYQGFALHAEGTATFSSQGATDVEASLEYNYTGPLYILGTVNNGTWAPNNYVAMTRGADGLYTVRVTTNAGNEGMSWISFTKRIANDNDNGAWGYIAPYRFVPYSEDVNTAWWLTDATVNQFNPLDFDQGHVDGQPVRMAPGTYDITINPNDNTFKIEPYIVTVETPTFDPAAGTYQAFQSVAINCATQGATIHYTTDGSEPTESSPVYSDPISVESTTTIKAIAMMSGMANSAIAEATYTLPQGVANIAAANALTDNPNFLFTGNAVVTYAGKSTINTNYGYIFIRDVGAENGGGVIFYNSSNPLPSVQATNVLKRGWYAQLRPYHNWKEFQYAQNVEASGESAAAAPFDRTGTELKYDDNVNEYIKIDNVTYSDGNITYAGQNREDVTYTYAVTNHFGVTLVDGKVYNIEAVVTRDNGNIILFPTAATLVQQNPNMSFAEQNVNATFGADFNEPALTKPEGVTVTYTSSDPTVAEVDATTGEVTIKKVGNATITATSAENQYYTIGTASYNIVVTAGTPTFAYSAAAKEVVFGTENPALPTLNNPNGLTVTYASSNPAVATVNENGEVTIVGAGTTVITATGAATGNYSGAEAQYTLTVTKAQAKVEYSDEAATATFGTEATLPTVATTPANLPLTYSSSHTDVATVDAQGVVSIVGIGQTTITAKFEGNGNYETAEDSYTLTVNAGTPTFAYSESTASAVFGETATLPTLNNPNNLGVTYSSTNTAVATVNAQGEVAIVGAGTTVITATGAATGNYNGATATYTLTVTKAQAKVEYSLSLIHI